jgi:uroporphyrinogen-III synthase
MSALTGKRIVITRAPHQAAEFEQLLRERGAVLLLYPCIDIAPPQNSAALDDALRALMSGKFEWLVLTSANSVQAIANRLMARNLSLSHVSSLKIAAVGPATAEAAQRLLGLQTSVIPTIYIADELANTFPVVNGSRVLLPQSAIAEDTLAKQLTVRGAKVTTVEAYQTVIGTGGVNLPLLLASAGVDAITLTSPSTVKNLLLRLENEGGDKNLLEKICIACIGTKTAAAADEHGLNVTIVPTEHTLRSLTTTLEQHFASVS